MKSHISNKALARHIAGTMKDRQQSRIVAHLAECEQCRARHGRMRSAIAPRYSTLHASDAAKVRVLRSRDRLSEDETVYTPAGIRSLLSRHPRAVLAGSLALVAAVATTAVILMRTPERETRPYLAAVSADAGVTINDRPAIARASVYESSIIILPDKTSARLEYGKGFSITLVGPALFTVDRLRSRGDSVPAELGCTLEQGILVSASDGTGTGLAYAYNTPGARVEPTGTEFLLQSAGGTTLVLMKTGSVKVRSGSTPESMTVAAGDRCMVKEKAETAKASPDDMKIFKSMDQLRDGAFAGRLLKPEPLREETGLKRKTIRERLLNNKTRSDIKHELKAPDNTRGDRSKFLRRDKIESPARDGKHNLEWKNKKKKQLREAKKVIRQKRRLK